MRAKLFIASFQEEKESNYQNLRRQLGLNRHYSGLFSFSMFWRTVAALVFALMFGAGSFYVYQNMSSKTNLFCEIKAPLGSRTQISLPDSTVVWLNSGSELKYSQVFGQTRDVFLEGEAFFKVHKNAKIPFYVHTKDLTVKVLGTTFDVNAYLENSSVIVNLLEGSVKAFDPANETKYVLLSPNQRLVYDRISKRMDVNIDCSDKSTLWVTGKLYFTKTPLADVLNTIQRKFNVKIVMKNKLMMNEFYSGSIAPNLSVKEMISFLDVDKRYRWEQVGDTIKIYDK